MARPPSPGTWGEMAAVTRGEDEPLALHVFTQFQPTQLEQVRHTRPPEREPGCKGGGRSDPYLDAPTYAAQSAH